MVEFDSSTKRYLPTDGFTPFLGGTEADFYPTWAATGTGHSVCTIPLPLRNSPNDILRDLSRAIYQNRSVMITYRSMKNPEGMERRISPHTIVDSGTRYHVRAYCHMRNEFRDFVLGRIASASAFGEQRKGASDDTQWNTLIVVRIGPHPGLTPAQSSVIEDDYAMVEGEAQIRISQALLRYLLKRLHLDEKGGDRNAEEQQVILLNQEIITLAAETK